MRSDILTNDVKQDSECNNLIQALSNLQNDSGVPKNLKTKISMMIQNLENNRFNSIIINKLLNELEEISNDINLQPFLRTQIYNISSLLEALQ